MRGMSEQSPSAELFIDHTLSFSLPARNARGRALRIGPVLERILSAHNYPPPIRNLLAEAVTVTALVGSLLKDEGSQLTLQAQAKSGPVSLLVCDYRDGELRGYVDYDPAAVADLGVDRSLKRLFGEGYLAVTFDLAVAEERYQGIVPLEGSSIAEACETYFDQSEQVPTMLRIAVDCDGDNCMAAGFLLQHLAEGEDGRDRIATREEHREWEHVSIMGGSVTGEELLDSDLSLESVIWRLFHEEEQVLVEQGPLLHRGCRCTVEHFESVIARFPKDEQAEMRDEEGTITVDCAFCSRKFALEA